ncbi:MAG: TolC family protein [Chitinivibrionia bacterium]|nr:TolC family protein [Chitinivibrionia bacterium]
MKILAIILLIFCTAFAQIDDTANNTVNDRNLGQSQGIAPTADPRRDDHRGRSDAIILSLEEALNMAVNGNPLLAIERIRTDIARTIIRERQYAFEPTITATYSAQEPFFDHNRASIALSQTAPTGTNIELSTRGATWAAPRDSNATARITITQSLLQGLGTRVNLAPVRRARIDLEISQEELSAYAQRLFAEVERSYWALMLSNKELQIFEYSLELANRLLFEAEQRLNAGTVAPIDLITIRAEVASREKQLFDAQIAREQRSLNLAFLINAPQFFDKEIILSDSTLTLGEADNLEDHILAAQEFRQDLRQANLLAERGELDLIQTKNGLLPRLDFFIALEGTSPNETFAIFPNDSDPRFSAGLQLQFPITSGAARQRHRAAQYTSQQRQLAISNFSRLIDFEIRSAHLEVSRAHRQIETAQLVSTLQKQKLEAEQEKLRVGRSTGYAVLQVQRDVVSANLDEARARIAYIEALLSLYSRDATLLARRGVSGHR